MRELNGWDRRDKDYPVLFHRCNFWAGVRDQKNTLIGFGYIAGMGFQHGYMEDILVHPDYQNLGLVRNIVKTLLKEAKKTSLEISPMMKNICDSIRNAALHRVLEGYGDRNERDRSQK